MNRSKWLSVLVTALCAAGCGGGKASETVLEVTVCGATLTSGDNIDLTITAGGQSDTQHYAVIKPLPTTLTATLPTTITGNVGIMATAKGNEAQAGITLKPGKVNPVDLCFGGCPCAGLADGGPDAVQPPPDLGPDAQRADLGPDAMHVDAVAPPDILFTDVQRPDLGPDMFMPPAVACNRTAPFAVPAAIPALSSSGTDQSPFLSQDGLYLYFVSERNGGAGGLDLYVSKRASANDPFGAPVALTSVSTPGQELGASLTADGKQLYFSSTTTAASSTFQIFRATRASGGDPITNPFGAPAQVQGLGISSVAAPWISPDGQRLYYQAQTAGGLDLYTADIDANGVAQNARPVTELNSAGNDGNPSLSADELFLYFTSDRAGGGIPKIYVALRASRQDPFLTPRLVPELASTGFGAETSVGISPDGCELFLSSNRGPLSVFGTRTAELYVTRRTTCDLAQNFGPTGVQGNVVSINGAFATNISPGSLSADGLRMYGVVDVSGVGNQVFVATRSKPNAAFGAPVVLTTTYAAVPGSESPDGKSLFFTRSVGVNDSDIYRADRTDVSQPFNLDSATPVAVLNSSQDEGAPVLAPDGQTVYFARNDFTQSPVLTTEMFATLQVDGTFTAPQPLPGFLQSNGTDSVASVSADQLTLYVTSYDLFTGGGGPQTLYDVGFVSRSTPTGALPGLRPTPFPFDNPTRSDVGEGGGVISPDGCSLFYAVSDPQVHPNYQLYEAQRPAFGPCGLIGQACCAQAPPSDCVQPSPGGVLAGTVKCSSRGLCENVDLGESADHGSGFGCPSSGFPCQTPNDLCIHFGFSAAVKTKAYWLSQCGGAPDCPGGFTDLDCGDPTCTGPNCAAWCGGTSCLGSNLCGLGIITSAPAPTDLLCATDNGGDCTNNSPGYRVLLQCL